MNIESKLVDSSRNLIDFVVAEINGNKALFDEALEIAFTGKKQIAPRAARVVCFCVEQKPELIHNRIDDLVENTINQKNKSVVMNFLKVFTFNILPKNEESLGKLVNYSFERLLDKEETAAITVYAMEILYLVTLSEPDLKSELIAVIEDRIPHGSPGIKYRGKKTIKRLKKI